MVAIAWLCALGALTAAFAPFHHLASVLHPVAPWLLGLASHWQWAYLAIGLGAATAAMLLKRHTALAAAALIVGAWFVHLPGAASPRTQAGAASAAGPVISLRVASANLNFENADLSKLLRWVNAPGAPDIVVLQEFTPAHQVQLEDASAEGLRARFPHRSLHPQVDQFGMAILSRYPLLGVEVVTPQDHLQTLRLRAVVDWPVGRFNLTAAHPMPPIGALYARSRDEGLRVEAALLGGADLPGILVGDLNDTPWGAGMRSVGIDLKRASGMAPTWPNAWGVFSLLPLDHVLVTRGWLRLSSSLGPDIGSDHRPVVAEIALR